MSYLPAVPIHAEGADNDRDESGQEADRRESGIAGIWRPEPVSIDTTFLRRCIASLERAVEGIERREGGDDVMYDIYRAACVKEFELVLEQSGKLLRKRLAVWFARNRQTDGLHFRHLFHHAARHGLIAPGAVERWLRYRDNRDFTAHHCGEDFAEATLRLLPAFIEDAKALAEVIERGRDA